MRRLRAAAVAALAVVLAGSLGGCKDKDGPTVISDEPTMVEQGQALKTLAAGKLTVCTDVGRPPFAMEENGEVRGIEADIVRGIGGRLSLVPVFVDVESAALLPSLDQGRCDLVASAVSIGGALGAASGTHAFSEGYFDVRPALLVRKADESRFADVAALKGRPVGVVKGSTGAALVTGDAGGSGGSGGEGEGVVVREFGSQAEALAALGSSSVDGVVIDQPIAAYDALTTGKTAVATVLGEAPVEQYGFVVPKGAASAGLLAALNKALRELRTDDSYRTIIAAYLGPTAG